MQSTTRQLEISPKDTMYEGNREHYFAVGESALRCIRTALIAANRPDPKTILDFACGFGRVLRALRTAYPAAELTACDVSRDGIEFCAATFGATPILSSEDPGTIEFKNKFDLIWCGSLLTHLEAAPFTKFLELFRSLLSGNGIVVCTTHGPFVARRMPSAGAEYGMDENSIATLLGGYHATGYGYVDYPRAVLPQVGVAKYGLSISKPSWVCRQIESLPNLRLIAYTERGWDNHQDAVAYMNE